MDADDTVNRAEDFADRQKSAGASRLDDMARAVHGAADELNGQMPLAAEFAHAAASRLERGAGALRDHTMRQLVGDLNAFGRRDPLMMFGGAAVAGFALSRLLKSAAHARR
jgi:hypothetical protein